MCVYVWGMHLCISCPGTVSVPSTLSVSEESGAVLVCATLAITPAAATTSRDVSVTLATSDGSGEVMKE